MAVAFRRLGRDDVRVSCSCVVVHPSLIGPGRKQKRSPSQIDFPNGKRRLLLHIFVCINISGRWRCRQTRSNIEKTGDRKLAVCRSNKLVVRLSCCHISCKIFFPRIYFLLQLYCGKFSLLLQFPTHTWRENRGVIKFFLSFPITFFFLPPGQKKAWRKKKGGKKVKGAFSLMKRTLFLF